MTSFLYCDMSCHDTMFELAHLTCRIMNQRPVLNVLSLCVDTQVTLPFRTGGTVLKHCRGRHVLNTKVDSCLVVLLDCCTCCTFFFTCQVNALSLCVKGNSCSF